MRNSIIQATFTGIILAILLSVGFYLMILLPKDTSISSYTNIVLFAGIVAIGTWVALKRITSRTPIAVNKMIVFICWTIIITSILFSVAAFCFTQFIDTAYLNELLQNSRQNWADKNYSLQAIAGQGEWTWYSSPINYALMHLKVMLVSLTIIMVPVAGIFYLRNKNRVPPLVYDNNPELIY